MKDLDGLNDKLQEKLPEYQKQYGASDLDMADVLLRSFWEYFEKVRTQEDLRKV